jgi:3-methylcrotonyl-CoA carboxylase alpha subunit
MRNKSMPAQIRSILIANRGEIAVRIIATSRSMGIRTVAIASRADERSPHALLADALYVLGEGTQLSETYLNQDAIVEIAAKANVDAIHPGYGFLSENRKFAERVRAEGFIFIGPPADCIESMGDKIGARRAAISAGVPIVPGYDDENQDTDVLKREAARIGYPVLIKASAGGGGKGMRVVNDPKDFDQALAQARGEAENAFGDSRVFLEKYLTHPRHIEVQVFSDTHGNHLHLFERECSVQRRHQKIVEETPSMALDDESREWVTSRAVALARAIGYEGAGTIEFIMDADPDTGKGNLYFLEMNTRLQVEHPVTECVTGLDLVRLQILVAQGLPIPFSQEEVRQNGHAIECRIYAEDPLRGHLPSTGILQSIGGVPMRNVRLDCGFADGQEVTAYYDPMIAKLIAWGPTRSEAIETMQRALRSYAFAGLKTNVRYLERILDVVDFKKGMTFTNFLVTHEQELSMPQASDYDCALAIGAYLLCSGSHGAGRVQQSSHAGKELSTVWGNSLLNGFRSA